MLQVQIFENADATELQDEVNDWLKTHPQVEVTHIAQSESAVADEEGDFCGNTTLTLFYRQQI
ncbi:MAG: hypothetical protein ACO1RX_16660 [Candidatus Sericytochromatia bacterium]